MSRLLTGRVMILLTPVLLLTGCNKKEFDITIELGDDEFVWAGMIAHGNQMPFDTVYESDFGRNYTNQVQPLILTSKGRYVWSEDPFYFRYTGDRIQINDPEGNVVSGKKGTTLREVQTHVRTQYFPASGLMPDTLLISAPQYNTWIELNLHQNEEDVLNYAAAIIENGMPPGVLMIDDTWQEDYGVWDFHPGRFANPAGMIDQLHDMGFQVMLWVCPFVSPDQSLLFSKLRREKALLLQKSAPDDTWGTVWHPAMIRWWNGVSAVLDFSNPAAVGWFNYQLDRLVSDYGIDGFKFDAADFKFYPGNTLSKGGFTPQEHCESYTQFGLRYPMNEYRACWKMGGQPLAQRLTDKGHTWEDLQKLIPNMILEALAGYTFSCPDLIGGGLLSTFSEDGTVNQELMVRSAQCHALMPMMQFSVAPWRVLDQTHFDAVLKAVETRKEFTSIILDRAVESAETGEPIMANMEYYYPHQGFAAVVDQFMVGPDLMVAPMVEPGTRRTVLLPPGTWEADDGNVYQGSEEVSVEVPLARLPYFKRAI